jgi:hypothetical protein
MTDLETIRKWEALRQEMKLWTYMELPKPFPEPFATMKLQAKIFDNTETAMFFSEGIAKVFKEKGIELKDDETFACLMCVVKKPMYISEAMGPTPQLMMMAPDSAGNLNWPWGVLSASAYRPIRYIMEPTIMKQVMQVREQDKIKY